MQIVADNFELKDMEDNISYLLDVSYNGYCEYELLRRNGDIYYLMAVNGKDNNYKPADDSILVGYDINELRELFYDKKEELLSTGMSENVSQINNVFDLYEVCIYLDAIETKVVKKHDYSYNLEKEL